MNISTNYHIGSPSISRVDHLGSNEQKNEQIQDDNESEDKPNLNIVQRMESPKIKKLIVSGDNGNEILVLKSRSPHLKGKNQGQEIIKTYADNLSEGSLRKEEDSVSSLDEKEELQQQATKRTNKEANYISVSELDAISKSQIRKESKELWRGFESPKFNTNINADNDEIPTKSHRKHETSEKSDSIDQQEHTNSGKKEILNKKDILSKFRELKARCQEIKEQGIEFESRLQRSKGKYNTYTNLNPKQSDEFPSHRNPLEGPKVSSVNSLRNILWKDKDTSIVKHANIGASYSTSAISMISQKGFF